MASGERLDRRAIDALFARYTPVVFRRARVLLGCDADAWDAVQEVFEKMIQHHTTFRGEARPMTWVYRITTNVCFNMLRSKRVRATTLNVVPEEPTLSVEASEARELLEVWVKHLDERELTIATLLYIDGLTQEEVADVLGISRKTVGREVEALRNKAEALGATGDNR